jgi:drug/metabolite transporter (DMT)-like permease
MVETEVDVAPESPRCHLWPLWFVLPACCDLGGTGIMYAGLALSSASVFQMLRGSSVIFTAVLSCAFLRRKIYGFQWFSVILVVVGVTIVGISSSSQSSGGSKDAAAVNIGNFLIIFAQLLVAVQMCVEEKIMAVYHAPALKVVGLEGTFGFCILGTLLVPMYFVHVGGYPLENAPDAVVQMKHNPVIIVAMAGNILSIAFFNFFGVSITKSMSASHRMVLDSVRTLLVWAVSLGLGWEKFHPLQLLGFSILTVGISMYNEVIKMPRVFKYPVKDETPSFVGDCDHGSFLVHEEGLAEKALLDQQAKGVAEPAPEQEPVSNEHRWGNLGA